MISIPQEPTQSDEEAHASSCWARKSSSYRPGQISPRKSRVSCLAVIEQKTSTKALTNPWRHWELRMALTSCIYTPQTGLHPSQKHARLCTKHGWRASFRDLASQTIQLIKSRKSLRSARNAASTHPPSTKASTTLFAGELKNDSSTSFESTTSPFTPTALLHVDSFRTRSPEPPPKTKTADGILHRLSAQNTQEITSMTLCSMQQRQCVRKHENMVSPVTLLPYDGQHGILTSMHHAETLSSLVPLGLSN